MINQGLTTDREFLIRYVAVEWYRWAIVGSDWFKVWNLKDVRQAIVLRLDDFVKYAKIHGNYDFTRSEVLQFYKVWDVGGIGD